MSGPSGHGTHRILAPSRRPPCIPKGRACSTTPGTADLRLAPGGVTRPLGRPGARHCTRWYRPPHGRLTPPGGEAHQAGGAAIDLVADQPRPPLSTIRVGVVGPPALVS